MSYRDEFEKMIEHIKISPNAPKEEVDRLFLPLMQFIGKNVPNQLYKFRGCTDYSIDAFEKDELWLSKAALFNDLHDSLFFFDKNAILDSIRNSFTPDVVSSVMEAMKKSNFLTLSCRKR